MDKQDIDIIRRIIMDKQYQDIKITNSKTRDIKIIREVTINRMTFKRDCVIIEYQSKDMKVTMELPKSNYAVTID